jgi:hypothetical protein
MKPMMKMINLMRSLVDESVIAATAAVMGWNDRAFQVAQVVTQVFYLSRRAAILWAASPRDDQAASLSYAEHSRADP